MTTTYDHYPTCGAESDDGYYCTLALGHAGRHEAWGTSHKPYAVWPEPEPEVIDHHVTCATPVEPLHTETLLGVTVGRRPDGALEAVVRFPDGSRLVADSKDPDLGFTEAQNVLHDVAHTLLAAHLGLDRSPVLERVVDLRPLTQREVDLEEATVFALQAWCAALRGEDPSAAVLNALTALERLAPWNRKVAS